jgi:hypothetical protein
MALDGQVITLRPSCWYTHTLELKIHLYSYFLDCDFILVEIGVILVLCFERLH